MTPPSGVSPHVHYRIAAYRAHHGWTQAHLAGLTGYTREYISMIENGRRDPNNYRLLSAMAHALGIDITALTTCTPDMITQPPDRAIVLRLPLTCLTATVDPAAGPGGDRPAIVLTDGVLRIELLAGDDGQHKQTRNGAVSLAETVAAFLAGRTTTGPSPTPDPPAPTTRPANI